MVHFQVFKKGGVTVKGLKHIKKENSYIKQFSTLNIMRNVSWAGNQHIRMLSGGSCDTEGISKLTGINYI